MPVHSSIFISKGCPDLVVGVRILFEENHGLGHVSKERPQGRPREGAIRLDSIYRAGMSSVTHFLHSVKASVK